MRLSSQVVIQYKGWIVMTIPQNTLIVKRTYDAIAEYFATMLEVSNSSKSEVEFMDLFLAQLLPNSTIIDLGCGVGKHGHYCASKGHHVTGYDISEEMIKLAKKCNTRYPMDFLCVADMCDIRSEALFDGVVAMYSLIHLTREQTICTFQNLKKNLKPNAKIVVSVLMGKGERYVPEVLRPDLMQFIKYYNEEELIELVTSLDFSVDSIRVWADEDEITASNLDLEFGVIGLIGTWRGKTK